MRKTAPIAANVIIILICLTSGVTQSYAEGEYTVNYSNTDRIQFLAESGDFIWCGSTGAAIRVKRYDSTVTSFRQNQGLIHAYINDIAVQSDGTVWFGTAAGLSSFDGISWTSFTKENGLDENEISAICVDGDDRLWIAANGSYCNGQNCYMNRSLQTYDGEFTTVSSHTYSYTDQRYRELAWNPVKNGVWASHDTATELYDLQLTKTLITVRGAIKEMKIDKTGGVWAVLFDGSVYVNDGTSENIYTVDNSILPGNALAIDLDTDDVAWIGSENGLCRFDGNDWTVWTKDNGLAHDSVNAVLVDGDNIVWAGTDDGLSRFNGKDFESIKSLHSLESNRANVIAEGPYGSMWFGSDNDGAISIFREDGTEFIFYDETPGGLPHWETYDIDFDRDGVAWIATPEGVSRYDGNTWITYTKKTGSIEDNFVKDILFDGDGTLWAMSYSGELASFNGEAWQSHTPNDWYVNQIALDQSGKIWAAGRHMYVYDPQSDKWTQYEKSTPSHCSAVIVDHNNVVWAAGKDGYSVNYIFRFEDGIWETLESIPEEISGSYVHAIAEDADGALWFAIDRVGVASYDNGTWDILTQERGLINNNVLTVMVDSNNVKWIGTALGVTALYTQKITFVENTAGREPHAVRIIGNYPNPFNPVTTIPFSLGHESEITFTVYNVAGEKVATLTERKFSEGAHSVTWDASGLASGIYFYTLKAVEFERTGKMTLLK